MGTLTLAWHPRSTPSKNPSIRAFPIPSFPCSAPQPRSLPMDETRNRLELALWVAAAVVALIYTYLI